MIYNAALTGKVHDELKNHLIRKDGQEDLCFGLWYPSTGKERTTALIYKTVLPQNGERKVHGNVGFLSEYFERVTALALQEDAGIAFLHSHSYPGWQNMSGIDRESENRMAAPVLAATKLPLVGLTIGNDGIWSARLWEKIGKSNYKEKWCEKVRVIGESLSISYNENILPSPNFKEELRRTFSAWGEKKQSNLMRLKIGIVGVGSVGSIVAESLARMGISHIKLIDFDYIEKKNLDRCLHATTEDVGRRKIDVIADSITRGATADNFQIDRVDFSVVEKEGYKEALDCDILFSCVDRPRARQMLNLIAYAHLIPVIDGGIHVTTNQTKTDIIGSDWKAHIASPGRRCMECLGQYNASLAMAEKNGDFEDPNYIKSLDDNHPIKSNENVFAFSLSLASLEVMQMLSMVIYPCKVATQFTYHFITGSMDTNNHTDCNNGCIFTKIIAKGDKSGFDLTGRDLKAEKVRQKHKEIIKKDKNFLQSILSFLNILKK